MAPLPHTLNKTEILRRLADGEEPSTQVHKLQLGGPGGIDVIRFPDEEIAVAGKMKALHLEGLVDVSQDQDDPVSRRYVITAKGRQVLLYVEDLVDDVDKDQGDLDGGGEERNAVTSDRLLTLDEVAEILRVSRDSVYGYARKQTIPAVKIGGHWRFSETLLWEWIYEATIRPEIAREAPRPTPAASVVAPVPVYYPRRYGARDGTFIPLRPLPELPEDA